MKKENSKEILNEILLRMKYDLNKTLSENKNILSEQGGGPYYDFLGNLTYDIGKGNINANRVYPEITNGQYPKKADFGKLQLALSTRNLKNITPQVTPTYTPLTSRQGQGMPSDYLGKGGRFQAQYPEYDPVQQQKKSELAKVEPYEFTKNLSTEELKKFLEERKRIKDLAPSVKLKEFNDKNRDAMRKTSMVSPQNFVPTNMDNYQKELADYTTNYQNSKLEGSKVLNYNLALYYPEKWKEKHSKGVDLHDVLFYTAIGVFAIPLLLVAVGASPLIVGTAVTAASIVSSSADVADALLYLNEEDYEMAGLSAIFALIPFVPNLARFGKSTIKSAVTKRAKGLPLTAKEVEALEVLGKEETQRLIKEAAEKLAKDKMTTKISQEVASATTKLEQKLGLTAAQSTTVKVAGKLIGTLAGFYVAGQSYEAAVDAYKKSQMSPINIYQKLVSEKKILLGWEDLKWAFGSDGSAPDNEKLAAALLAGYKGDEDGLIFIYKNPKFQTSTWKTRWAKAAQIKVDEKRTEELLKQDAKTPEEQEQNDEELTNIQTKKLTTTSDGVEHTKEEIKNNIDDVLNDPDL